MFVFMPMYGSKQVEGTSNGKQSAKETSLAAENGFKHPASSTDRRDLPSNMAGMNGTSPEVGVVLLSPQSVSLSKKKSCAIIFAHIPFKSSIDK